jgi:hypothetical protein
MKTLLSTTVYSLNALLNWLSSIVNRSGQGKLIPIPVPVQNAKKCSMLFFGIGILATGAVQAQSQRLTTNLFAATANGYSLADGNLVLYNELYSNAVDNFDARKMPNFGENFGIIRNSEILAVEKRNIIRNNDSVFFDMSNLKNISYRLQIVGYLFSPDLLGFLEDSYTQTRTPIHVNDTLYYDFNVTAQAAASSARNRFRVVFEKPAFGPLPVHFVQVLSHINNGMAWLNWQVAEQFNVAHYSIERSYNGQRFTEAARVPAVVQQRHYRFSEVLVEDRTVYYRIKSVDTDGNTQYSKIIVVAKGEADNSSFAISPNPVEGIYANVFFNQQPAGVYHIKFLSANGQVLAQNITRHVGGTTRYSIGLPGNMRNGYYKIVITGPGFQGKAVPFIFKGL